MGLNEGTEKIRVEKINRKCGGREENEEWRGGDEEETEVCDDLILTCTDLREHTHTHRENRKVKNILEQFECVSKIKEEQHC